MHNNYKFIFSFLFFLIIIFSFIFFINKTIDPYYYFKINHNFNFYKEGTKWEREYKSRLIENNEFDFLLMGDSKVSFIQTEKYTKNKIMNGSFEGASLLEIYEFLIQKKPKTKNIIIGIDIYHFNENYLSGQFWTEKSQLYDKKIFSKIKYLFSNKTTYYSFNEIKCFFNSCPKAFTEYGSRNPVTRILRDKNTLYDKPEVKIYYDLYVKDYKISNESLELIEKIKLYSKENNINLFFFINPMRNSIYEVNKKFFDNNWNKLKELIEEDNGQIIKLRDIYNNDKLFFKSDLLHYSVENGDLILSEIMNYIKEQ